MANYNDLKTGIDAVIKTNGRQEISGAALNTQLKNMIAELGAGYQYMGVATPATNPGTPDANVFYFASEAGTYTNFRGIVINEGEVCALVWNGTWTKQVTGAATADKLNQLGQKLKSNNIFSVTGFLIKMSDGDVSTNSNYKVTPLMLVDKANDVVYKGIYSLSNAVAAICFYDEDVKPIENGRYTQASGTLTISKSSIPANAKYFRCCNYIGGTGETIENGSMASVNATTAEAVISMTTLKNNIASSLGIFSIQGKLILQSSGELYNKADYSVTPLIALDKNNDLVYKGIYPLSNSIAAIAFYDENGSPIENSMITTQAGSVTVLKANIPNGAIYFRCCNYTSFINSATRIFNANFASTNARVASVEQNMLEKVEKSRFNTIVFKKKSAILKNDGYVKTSGEVIVVNTFKHSDYIPFNSNCELHVSGLGANSGIANVSFYDRNKTCITSASISNQSSVDLISGIPENTYYIRICSWTQYESGEFYFSVTSLYNILMDSVNPLSKLSILTLGDSITYRGTFQPYLSSLCGGLNKIDNKGVSGRKGWQMIYDNVNTDRLIGGQVLSAYNMILIGSFANDYCSTTELGTMSDSIGTRQKATLELSIGTLTAGNITISFGSDSFNIAIAATDSLQDVIGKIVATDFYNWDAIENNGNIVFERKVAAANVTISFNDNGVGITGNITNDVAGVAMANTFYAAWKTNLDYLTRTCPQMPIFVWGNMPIVYEYNLPYGSPNNIGVTMYQYADALREVCRKYGVTYIDLMYESGINENNYKLYYREGELPGAIHPNDTIGMQRMAYHFYSKMACFKDLLINN